MNPHPWPDLREQIESGIAILGCIGATGVLLLGVVAIQLAMLLTRLPTRQAPSLPAEASKGGPVPPGDDDSLSTDDDDWLSDADFWKRR